MLPAKEAYPHVGWPSKGRCSDSLLPQHRTLAPFCGHGRQDQAVGGLRSASPHSHISRAHEGASVPTLLLLLLLLLLPQTRTQIMLTHTHTHHAHMVSLLLPVQLSDCLCCAQGVRDIAFNNDGTRFVSCGYDKLIRLWDTESGECLGHYTNRHVPYCVKFHPDGDKQHLFVAGTSDKKILCWDTNTNEIVQEYDRCVCCTKKDRREVERSRGREVERSRGREVERFRQTDRRTDRHIQTQTQAHTHTHTHRHTHTHCTLRPCASLRFFGGLRSHLGAVNTITFVEEGRRMVTTSDDKSMRVWEWDIPVDIKYIADPSMHSMPSVAVHPNGIKQI